MSLNRFRTILKLSPVLLRPLWNTKQRILQHNKSFLRNCATGPDQNALQSKADIKMKIEFTCKVCNTRNEKYFSKTAYTKGVVLIKCDGCKNVHLIADNLNWFSNVGKRNIEEILAEKGVQVKKGVIVNPESENSDVNSDKLELCKSSSS